MHESMHLGSAEVTLGSARDAALIPVARGLVDSRSEPLWDAPRWTPAQVGS